MSVLIFLVSPDISYPHDSRKENLPRNLNCPISLGMLPSSDVKPPSRYNKEVSSPISVGIVPPFLLPESARRTASLERKESNHVLAQQ